MARGDRKQRWTVFVAVCLAVAFMGRVNPLQWGLLGIGLVSIGVAVLTTRHRISGQQH